MSGFRSLFRGKAALTGCIFEGYQCIFRTFKMLHIKKYLTEGLIQFTILLSLIGVRVDVDTYLSGYLSPLLETNIGPSSAYIQTDFHNLRDTLDGNSLHPKCPDLDSYFASRRLLHEVRALGSPRFPTRLSAWLVHLVPAGAESSPAAQNSTGAALTDGVTDGDSGGQTDAEEDDSCTFYRRRLLEDGSQSADPENGTRPCPSGACKEVATELHRGGAFPQNKPSVYLNHSPMIIYSLVLLTHVRGASVNVT